MYRQGEVVSLRHIYSFYEILVEGPNGPAFTFSPAYKLAYVFEDYKCDKICFKIHEKS